MQRGERVVGAGKWEEGGGVIREDERAWGGEGVSFHA